MSNIIPKGRYAAKCEKWGFVGFKSKKTEGEVLKFFAADFKITAEGPYCGQYVSMRSSTKEGGREFTAKVMEAMGWERGTDPRGSKLDNDVIVEIDHEEARDSNGNLVTDDEGNTVWRAYAKYVNALGGGMVDRFKMEKPDEDAFVKEFVATTKVATRVAKKATPAATPRNHEPPMTGGPGGGDVSGDDIPF